MRLNFLAYTLLSALCIGALPTHRGNRRADALYTKCLAKGNEILHDIQSSRADTQGLTDKYNKLYAPLMKKATFGSSSRTVQEIGTLLDITISNLVQISVTRPGQGRQVAYKNYFDVDSGIIVAAENFNARFFYIEEDPESNKADPVKTAANSLQWNTIVGEQYKSLDGSLARLQHILRYQILNDDTEEIIKQAVDQKLGLPVERGWTVAQPGSPGSAGDNMFKALLGTENGRGAGYMLKDYRSSMPGKAIKRIRVQIEDGIPMMVIDF
ncbi:hypothetical protein B0H19DRAFT_1263248 [Mycena capillaripes]|nr:hypothetical protein B0H19DRAFT_1263248 [Mycena capillaripes]